MVADVIGMAGSNHGTTVLQNCKAGQTKCPPADWQQGAGAKFLRALNSRAETFAGISYTEIYTHTDEVVQPNGNGKTRASSALHTGRGTITNVPTQSICPLDVDEHLTVGTIDPVTYALVMDALRHRGPAAAAAHRPRGVQPGVPARRRPGERADLSPDARRRARPALGQHPGRQHRRRARGAREPKLRCYVFTPAAADPRRVVRPSPAGGAGTGGQLSSPFRVVRPSPGHRTAEGRTTRGTVRRGGRSAGRRRRRASRASPTSRRTRAARAAASAPSSRGATTISSGIADAAANGSSSSVARQSESSTTTRRPARASRQRLGAEAQRAGEPGDAVPAQPQHAVDDRRRRHGDRCSVRSGRTSRANAATACSRRGPQRARGGHHRGRGEPGAGHRAGVVDEQAQRELGRPQSRAVRSSRCGGPLLGARRHDRVQRRVEVEVAAARGRHRPRPPGAAPDDAPAPRAVEDQPGRQPLRRGPQPLVGRGRQVGEQGERGVGSRCHLPRERVLVELARPRARPPRTLVPGELGAPDRAVARFRAAVRAPVSVPADRRAQASPGERPSGPGSESGAAGGGPNTSS